MSPWTFIVSALSSVFDRRAPKLPMPSGGDLRAFLLGEVRSRALGGATLTDLRDLADAEFEQSGGLPSAMVHVALGRLRDEGTVHSRVVNSNRRTKRKSQRWYPRTDGGKRVSAPSSLAVHGTTS